MLGVLGPNGAGKTTAVRVLATLLQADSGRATIDGLRRRQGAAKVRRTIGLTGQYASVDEDLTGTQNLVLIGQLLNLPDPRRQGAGRRTARLVRPGRRRQQPAKTYSGGMRRRLDLAASLVGRPPVIFLDEPTTGLDPAKREDMWDVVRRLVTDGSTVLLTTQYLEEADALADEISVIDHGKVIAHDTPDGLKRSIGGQRIRSARPTRRGWPTSQRILAEIAGNEPQATGRDELTVPVDDEERPAAAVSADWPPTASPSPNCPCTCRPWTRSSSPSPATAAPKTDERDRNRRRRHDHDRPPPGRAIAGRRTPPRPAAGLQRLFPARHSRWPSAA